MSSIVTDVGRLIYDYPETRVYVRQKWSEPWTLVPELFVNYCQWVASPGLSRAAVYYDYGQVLPIGGTQMVDRPPLIYLGYWIKIEIDQAAEFGTNTPRAVAKWYGRIWEEPRDRTGRIGDYVNGNQYVETKTGVQEYSALGLEYELERAYVTSTVIEAEEGEEEKRLGRGIAFNRAFGDAFNHPTDVRGNASTATGQKGTPVFSRTLGDSATWKAREIIEYLLAYQTALDQQGNAILPWSLDVAEADFLSWHKPFIEPHGRSVRSIIDEIIDRRRLLGWRVVVEDAQGDGGGEAVKVKPFTFATEPILSDNAGEGEDPETLIPANPDQRTLDFESALDVVVAGTTESQLHKVDRIVLLGARRTTTATLSALDNTITSDWITSEKDAYNSAATAEDGYDDADRMTKEQMNYRARTKLQLERVFRQFRLPSDWDGKVGNGVGEGTKVFAHPKLDIDGKVTEETDPFWPSGIRFEPYLPIETGRDFVDVEFAAPDNLPASDLPEDTEPDFRRPFAAIKIAPLGEEEGDDVYMPVGDLGHALAENEDNGGRKWGANLRLLTKAPAFCIDVNHRGWQHKIAKQEFVALDFDTHCYDEPADLDWQDNLLATVCWQNDEYTRVVYPRDTNFPDADAIREQVILLGDDYRLDWIAPYTVIDIQNGVLKRVTGGGGFVRNDLAKMRSLAKIAYSWYSRPRKAFTLGYRQLLALANIGDMITTIGPEGDTEEVNTVVTSLAFSFGREPQTTLQTDFAEFDVTAFERGKDQAKGRGRHG